jgi:hypothetical protein
LSRSIVCPYSIHANPRLVTVPMTGSTIEPIAIGKFPLYNSIAKDSFWLLSKNESMPGPERLHGLYYQIFRERGYLRADGSVRVKNLSNDLREYFGPGFLNRLSTDFDPGQRGNWVERLARRPRNTQAPLRHLLLIRFLGLTAKGAIDQAKQCAPVTARMSTKPHRNQIKQRNKLAHLRTMERHRWMKLLTAPRKGSVRVQHDNLYSWLWRNDHAWLMRHRPSRMAWSKTRINWAHWDKILSHRVEQISAELKCRKQPFVRLTWNRLASASGKTSWLAKPNEKLPTTCRAIARHSETCEQFAIRRLTVIGLGDKLKDGSLWRLRVAAGISTGLAKRSVVHAALLRESIKLASARAKNSG